MMKKTIVGTVSVQQPKSIEVEFPLYLVGDFGGDDYDSLHYYRLAEDGWMSELSVMTWPGIDKRSFEADVGRWVDSELVRMLSSSDYRRSDAATFNRAVADAVAHVSKLASQD